jgi:PAP2 superfamily C-terminal
MDSEAVVVEVASGWHVRLWRRYRESWFDRHVRFSTLVGLVIFAASVTASFYAIAYATASASNPVTDIILSNTPIIDVDGIMVAGTLLLIASITFLLAHHPRRLPFGLHALALFFFIRSAFTVATHIASYPIPAANTAADLTNAAGRFFFGFGGDLFFSAHTGVPFLIALMFWHKPLVRNVFLAWSVFFGVVVLVGHLHYTIDVFSAFFISYGIYHLALWLFPKEYAYFRAAE